MRLLHFRTEGITFSLDKTDEIAFFIPIALHLICIMLRPALLFLVLLRVSWLKSGESVMISNAMDIQYLRGYRLICEEKSYPQAVCDVRSHYSTVLPLSSNQNQGPDSGLGNQPCSDSDGTRPALCTRMPSLRQESRHGSQMDGPFGPGPGHGRHPGLARLPLPQVLLCRLPADRDRGSGAV
jgi:hypothetical protein